MGIGRANRKIFDQSKLDYLTGSTNPSLNIKAIIKDLSAFKTTNVADEKSQGYILS